MSEQLQRARDFLAGEALYFTEAHALWQMLLNQNDLSVARAVLARLREAYADDQVLFDAIPADRALRTKLCQQEAHLTSKDEELSAGVRHARAIAVLEHEFGALIESTDPETLGIAAGIYKRKWYDLGQPVDLEQSAALYERGADAPIDTEAYPHINAAFLHDLLASRGNDPITRRARATAIRERIAAELKPTSSWWNAVTRAEALFGLGRFAEATAAISGVARPPLWQLEASVRQLATLAHLQIAGRPLDNPAVHTFFEALFPKAAVAVRSAFIGKVGLALSGGGFRASFYHLGVLARLAELNVLRHVDVLSCVSGGSIVGACYWLALRERLLDPAPLGNDAYVGIVQGLIARFSDAVAMDLRAGVQPSKVAVALGFLKGNKGALDPEAVAEVLEESFYRPFIPGDGPLFMHELAFTPADHTTGPLGTEAFNPTRHNWLRAHKVPSLVINATTINTGHGWQFTPTWMGESPWAIHDAADVVPRLQWARYTDTWKVRLGRAVAASACVPGVFDPVKLQAPYQHQPAIDVRLVDGGVYDNQGTVGLLANNCNVLLVSDAAGQLLLEPAPTPGLGGLLSYASRAMDTLMERIRQANYADLAARKMTGLVRGMMFLHMKAGLDADPIRLDFSDEAYTLKRSTLSPSGVRKDLQQALAELRTDLNVFTPDEAQSLMACGYQMAAKAFQRDVGHISELFDAPVAATWVFADRLGDLKSTSKRDELLATLRLGNSVRL